jgi:site-specific recombinase XerD
MANTYYIPKPVFDTMNEVIDQYKNISISKDPYCIIQVWLNQCFANSKVKIPSFAAKDYQLALSFLYSYRGSSDTFVAYRRNLEQLLQWSWFVCKKSILKLKREDIEAFIEFCIKPYKRWIGLKKVARFKLKNGTKAPNPEWRPFEARISKQDRKMGKTPTKNDYKLSQQALKVMFGVLSSFYNYLLQQEVTQVNPVLLIRQKSKFLRKEANAPTIRRLSEKQWQMVIDIAKDKAKADKQHERTIFILSCLYGMYLRISELVVNNRWAPTMSDFFQDHEGNWWFRTVGKGNKTRQIAVSRSMLEALKTYRVNYLGLSPHPLPSEKTPLISHANNIDKPMTSERLIRSLVQSCFDQAADKLESLNEKHEANLLRTATVHWLRHTGISEDVKIRPREHVRDDAGHSSSAITDRYIDAELQERAKSARKKKIDKQDQKKIKKVKKEKGEEK